MDNKALLRMAYEAATWSPDPSTQIGAFLVSYNGQLETLTTACNRPSLGYNMTASDWEAPRKYSLMEHAERNVCYKAAKHGISMAGGILVSSWAACSDCARAIVACGIDTLIRHVPPPDEASARWAASIDLGDQILKAGGVAVMDVHGGIPGAPKILRNGVMFDPSLGGN